MISRLHAAALAACLTMMAAPAWADFAHAKETYAAGQFEDALTELKPLAEGGNAKAQELLGRMYMKGQGVAVDKKQARDWLGRAADQGNSEAGRELGYLTAKEIDWDTTMSSPSNRDALMDSDGKLVAYRLHGLALPIPHGYEGPQLTAANNVSGGIVRFYKKNVDGQAISVVMTLAASLKVSEYANLKDDAANKAESRKGLVSMVDLLTKANLEFRSGQPEEVTVADKAAYRVWFSTKNNNAPDRGWLYYLVQGGRFYYMRIDQIEPRPTPSAQNPGHDDQSDQSGTDALVGPNTDHTGDATGAFEASTFQPEEEYGR